MNRCIFYAVLSNCLWFTFKTQSFKTVVWITIIQLYRAFCIWCKFYSVQKRCFILKLMYYAWSYKQCISYQYRLSFVLPLRSPWYKKPWVLIFWYCAHVYSYMTTQRKIVLFECQIRNFCKGWHKYYVTHNAPHCIPCNYHDQCISSLNYSFFQIICARCYQKCSPKIDTVYRLGLFALERYKGIKVHSCIVYATRADCLNQVIFGLLRNFQNVLVCMHPDSVSTLLDFMYAGSVRGNIHPWTLQLWFSWYKH